MTDKTEAQPEALRLADRLDLYATGDEHQRDVEESADELRRQHAEIQQLKAERDLRTVERDGANERVRLMLNAKNQWMNRAKAAEAQLVAQTNRAAAAEQQVTALTQRLDMANRLNTDARDQLAQLSARQAAPDDALRDALVRARDWFESQAKVVSKGCGSPWNLMQLRDERDAADAALSAAPPPPEREPLTDEQILQLFIEMYGQEPVDITEFAEVCGRVEKHHGIGATNDNP